MTIKEVIEYVDAVKPNSYTNEIKTAWLNEIEGMVQTEIMLLAPEEVIRYSWNEQSKKVQFKYALFPDDHTMLVGLPSLDLKVGWNVRISGLTQFTDNNVTARIVGMEPSHKQSTYLYFPEGTFASVSEDEEDVDLGTATVEYVGGQSELLVLAPHDKIYHAYVQSMIDYYNNEFERYANSRAIFNAFYEEYKKWYSFRINPATGKVFAMGYYLSAYGIAVKNGYSGTEEEWLTSLKGDQAQSTTDAQNAAAAAALSASEASGSASSASASSTAATNAKLAAVLAKDASVSAKDNAVIAQNAAQQSAIDAGNSADAASGSAANASSFADDAEGFKDEAETARDNAIAATATKADKLMATNLITNGDFSQGTTGWTFAGLVASVAANEVTLTSTINGTPRIFQIPDSIFGNKYYSGVFIRRASGEPFKITFGYGNELSFTGRDNYEKFDGILIPTGTASYSIYFENAIINEKIQVKFINLIDLTATFGAGNEPTAAEMDKILAAFPNSWFDGTAEILPLQALYNLKANKIQEDWITPTLLNSWTQADATNMPVRYRKDEFGIMHLSGRLSGGTAGTVAFTLPVGYRPSKRVGFACYTSSGTHGKAYALATGEVYIYEFNSYIQIDSMSFFVD